MAAKKINYTTLRTAPRTKEANHAVAFINQLTLSGEFLGQKVKLRPWQEAIVRHIFGSRDKQGRRKIRKVFILLPRSSGKTQLIAFLVVYCLVGLPQRGQQILSAATTREQAAHVYRAAEAAIRENKTLSSLVETVPSQKRLVISSKSNVYAALSAQGTGALGFNPSIVIFDEFQSFKHENEVQLFQNLTTSFAKRTDTLTIMIGTGSPEINDLMQVELEYAKKVEAGIVKDESYLPVIYQATDEEAENWDEEKVWRRVMPALGDFADLDFIRREAKEAKEIPAKKSQFLAYYLNRFLKSQHSWIDDAVWMRNSTPPIGTKSIEYYAGLDLASVRDSNALTLYGKRPDGKFDVVPFVWVCEQQVINRTQTDINYSHWVDKGEIRVAGMDIADQMQIVNDIIQFSQQYNIKEIGCDPHLAMSYVAPTIEKAGIKISYIPQNVSYMSEPLKEIERQTLNAELCHGGNGVLRWQLSNAWCVPDANNNYFLNKSKSTDQIDAIAGLWMARFLYQQANQQPTELTAADLLFFV